MSTAIDRLPRLQLTNSALTPLCDVPTQRARSPMPGRSTLIDLGALVGQQRGGVRAGGGDRQVDDADAGERPAERIGVPPAVDRHGSNTSWVRGRPPGPL